MTLISSFLSWVRTAVASRFEAMPAWFAITQIFIGLGWLRAATEKLITASWWTGADLRTFVAEHDGLGMPMYQGFIDNVVLPYAGENSLFVMALQFVVGLSLLSGRLIGPALATGMFMNLNFVAAGAVDPSVFYLLSQGGLLLWLAERSRRRTTNTALDATWFGGIALAAVSVPSIGTLHPADVIYDPSVILATVGAMAAVGTWLCRQRRMRVAEMADATAAVHFGHAQSREATAATGSGRR